MGSGWFMGCGVNLARWVLQGLLGTWLPLAALCQPLWVLRLLSERVMATFHTANASSTPAAVPIALGDGGRCGGQKSSSSSANSVGS